MDGCQNEIDFEELEKLCSDDAVAGSMVRKSLFCVCVFRIFIGFFCFVDARLMGPGTLEKSMANV